MKARTFLLPMLGAAVATISTVIISSVVALNPDVTGADSYFFGATIAHFLTMLFAEKLIWRKIEVVTSLNMFVFQIYILSTLWWMIAPFPPISHHMYLFHFVSFQLAMLIIFGIVLSIQYSIFQAFPDKKIEKRKRKENPELVIDEDQLKNNLRDFWGIRDCKVDDPDLETMMNLPVHGMRSSRK